jgi:uncharacterized membrane protein YagU involved in acid resistance
MLLGNWFGGMATEPPRQIVHKLTGSRSALMTLVAHFGFGALCGVAYSAMPKPREAPPTVAGATFGVGVWALNYVGLLPTLGILSPPEDAPRRAVTMSTAHVVYGTALGWYASRHG